MARWRCPKWTGTHAELQCIKVEDHYVLRDGASGIFLAASQFPKHRETRPPFVDELLPHSGRD